MTLSEKSAYLKGLMEGMKLSTETDEGKMIAALVDTVGQIASASHRDSETVSPLSLCRMANMGRPE